MEDQEERKKPRRLFPAIREWGRAHSNACHRNHDLWSNLRRFLWRGSSFPSPSRTPCIYHSCSLPLYCQRGKRAVCTRWNSSSNLSATPSHTFESGPLTLLTSTSSSQYSSPWEALR